MRKSNSFCDESQTLNPHLAMIKGKFSKRWPSSSLAETPIRETWLQGVCLKSNVDALARNSLSDAIRFLPRPEKRDTPTLIASISKILILHYHASNSPQRSSVSIPTSHHRNHVTKRKNSSTRIPDQTGELLSSASCESPTTNSSLHLDARQSRTASPLPSN